MPEFIGVEAVDLNYFKVWRIGYILGRYDGTAVAVDIVAERHIRLPYEVCALGGLRVVRLIFGVKNARKQAVFDIDEVVPRVIDYIFYNLRVYADGTEHHEVGGFAKPHRALHARGNAYRYSLKGAGGIKNERGVSVAPAESVHGRRDKNVAGAEVDHVEQPVGEIVVRAAEIGGVVLYLSVVEKVALAAENKVFVVPVFVEGGSRQSRLVIEKIVVLVRPLLFIEHSGYVLHGVGRHRARQRVGYFVRYDEERRNHCEKKQHAQHCGYCNSYGRGHKRTLSLFARNGLPPYGIIKLYTIICVLASALHKAIIKARRDKSRRASVYNNKTR